MEKDGYLITGNTDGSYNTPVVDNSVNVSLLTEQTTGIADGDLNGDGYWDLSIDGALGIQQDIWVLGNSGSTPTVTQAPPITGPSASSTGTFTLTWTSGYELRSANSSWRYADDTNTSHTFTDLPSGVYKFEIYSCSTVLDCEGQGDIKTVTVSRSAEPLIDHATTEAGTTEYSATTTQKGTSRISVPIRTIPGVNGFAPNLSLRYDSGRGIDIFSNTRFKTTSVMVGVSKAYQRSSDVKQTDDYS